MSPRRNGRRRWVGAWMAAAVVVATVLVGCGVPTQSRAQVVDPDSLPPPLLATTTLAPTTVPAPATTSGPTTIAPTAPPTAPPAPTETVGLYYVQGGPQPLVRVQHDVPTGDVSAPLAPAVVLDELVTGPRAGDPPGLRSALLPGQVAGVDVNRGTAAVDLRPSFRDLDSVDQELAIAQIVLTLTERGAGALSFTLAGQPIQVPTAEAAQTLGPVTREDYERQLDQTAAPTATPTGTSAPSTPTTTAATAPATSPSETSPPTVADSSSPTG